MWVCKKNTPLIGFIAICFRAFSTGCISKGACDLVPAGQKPSNKSFIQKRGKNQN